ncbi:glycoside hydrolase family 3 C-terminal domain-containing protein [Actinoplanes aureus]|uniref:Exo-alpha-(1->6)-L-arabinopyranosidase n=1 Tax=Actinoplanes aureus TaxID=2792083 RepID=A0A931G0G6_9ACTN|nr:glycoside hydrolase family 3 C-terminal domain-containing protein [Actinoplanes aureus]MBG0564046.1 glycoside hydrolase family 3 C-terminal domain-containing protein [Actinoplanes aureus]
MDLDRRAALTSGSDTWHTTGDDGLPALTLADGPHGVRRAREGGDALGIGDSIPATCYPPAVALGSTWNPDLVRRVGRALGSEARALGVDVLLGPGMNIKRSPLGGRNFEYFAEDPHLTGVLAAAMVEGIQSAGVGACVKHFAVNNQESDRMRISAEVDERALREVYLAGFEHVVRTARPWALMSAYNRVNGVPASENSWLLTDVLRGEWGFDGVVVSDWGAVSDRVAAVRAGCDVEMPPTGTDHLIASAVRGGTLDAAVLNRVRSRLALLHQRVSSSTGVRAGDSPARQAATEAAVLLKNDGAILPLVDPGRLAVVGELARTPRYQGGGSSRVVPTALSSVLEALVDRLGDAITFAPGYGGPSPEELITEALNAAQGADAVVLVLGLAENAESEGFDRATIALPGDQLRLLARLAEVNSNIVVVLANGGVVSVAEWRDQARAILEGWLPGQAGGEALADLLLGVHSPSGRLAETIPLRLADHPSHLHFPGRDGQVVYGESVYVGYRHFDTLGVPVAYPFGHGLTYTTFEYSDLSITEIGDLRWEIGCTITNTGERAGQEVVQLYTGLSEAAPSRPRSVLRGFAKVNIEPGQARHVTLTLTGRDLAVWDVRHQRWTVDAGTYEIRVGASSRDIRLTGELHTGGDGFRPPLTATSTVGEWRAHPVGGPLLGRVLQQARAGRTTEIAPELLRMVDGMPLITLRTFGLGLTPDVIAALVDQTR